MEGFCANEAAFYVGMDFACGVVGDSALLYGPGVHFVGADGEKADKAEGFEAGVHEFECGGLGDAHIGHKIGLACRVKLGKLIFEFGANGDDAGAGWHYVGESECFG